MIPSYVWTILFYSTIVLLLILFRKRFARQGIVFLYRTKWGIKLMHRLAKRSPGFWHTYGLVGIGIGFVGMGFIVYMLLQNLWMLFTTPSAQSGVSLVLPGVNMPGSPLQIPLITGWVALFITVVIHEFSHGVVSKAYGLDIKSSGIAFMGPIAGAFVEPDEKQLFKQPSHVQHAMFSAGPFANIIIGFLALAVLSLVMVPITDSMTHPSGFSVNDVQEGYPADKSGVPDGVIITSFNGIVVEDYTQFSGLIQKVRPGETVVLGTENASYTVVTEPKAGDNTTAYIGVMGLKNHRELNNAAMEPLYSVLVSIEEFIFLLFILMIGIGTANLLPVGPIDGGRMFKRAADDIWGEKKGDKVWVAVSYFVLGILVLNLLFPLFRWLYLLVA